MCGKCYEGNCRLLAELVLSSSQRANISHCCLNQILFTSVDILLIFTSQARTIFSSILTRNETCSRGYKTTGSVLSSPLIGTEAEKEVSYAFA